MAIGIGDVREFEISTQICHDKAREVVGKFFSDHKF